MEHETTDDLLVQLGRMADELDQAMQRRDELAAKLKLEEDTIRLLEEEQLPELLQEVGVDRITTKNGLNVELDIDVKAKIPNYRKGEALKWLDAHGEGGMAKRTVTVFFNRDQEEDADFLTENLEKDYPAGVTKDYSVHASTLKAWAKRKVEAGDEFPHELFGVQIFRRAKVNRNK